MKIAIMKSAKLTCMSADQIIQLGTRARKSGHSCADRHSAAGRRRRALSARIEPGSLPEAATTHKGVQLSDYAVRLYTATLMRAGGVPRTAEMRALGVISLIAGAALAAKAFGAI